MKKILESDNGAINALNILNGIFKNTVDPFGYTSPSFSAPKIRTFREILKFGDSIYIISDPNDPIEVQIDKLILRVTTLIALGIYLYEYKFFLRCGIAKGDLLDVQVWMPNNAPAHLRNINQRIIIGNSLSRANYLEKNQNWIGGAVMGDINCKRSMNYLVEYKIPLKDKMPKAYKPKYAINWLKLLSENNIEIKELNIIDDIANSIGGIKRIDKKKIKNTKKFIKKINNL
jgi:hypothetical protein